MTHAPAAPSPQFQVLIHEAWMPAIKRISLEQIDLAIWHLAADNDIGTGIHEARKALKRTRAMLRLLRHAVGRPAYATANILFRDAGRGLSALRVSAVLGQTVGTVVAAASPDIPDAAVQPLLQHLQGRHQHMRRQAIEQVHVLEQVAASLVRGRRLVEDLHSPSHDFNALAPGLRRTYRRGRHEYLATLATPAPYHFHLWRKRVKYLRYQMQVLVCLWPPQMQVTTDQLVELSRLLGLQHDLVDLENYLATLSDDKLKATAALLQEPARAYRSRLEEEALHLGRYLYAERPHAFGRRLQQYWLAGLHPAA